MKGLRADGFADGFLRGYSTLKNQQNTEERLRMEQERLDENTRRYEDGVAYQTERDKVADERYNKEQEILAAERKDQAALRKIQHQSYQANINLKSYQQQVEEKKAKLLERQSYLTENLPLLKAHTRRFMETGEVNEIFDNEHVKGGAYDPRRYTPQLVSAAFDIEKSMPKVLSGELDYRDKGFAKSMGTLLQSNVDKVIGEVGKDGKPITSAKLARYDLVADINPEMAGAQPALVLGLDLTYEGSDKVVSAPVTENRSTDPNDNVKIIPLDSFMKDVTGQIGMAKQYFTSEHYSNLFGTKDATGLEKEYREAITELEKDRTESLSEQLTPTEESTLRINNMFDERRKTLDEVYGRLLGGEKVTIDTQASEWAGNDPTKHEYIEGLKSAGYITDKTTIEMIDANYANYLKLVEEKDSAGIIDKVLNAVKPDPKPPQEQQTEQGLSHYQQMEDEYASRTPQGLRNMASAVSSVVSVPDPTYAKTKDYSDYKGTARPF